ncbi:MAG: PIN/TRAM domain-containing protein [Isosphaeraceae bacterium]|jgi:uncharacterized protein YacL|nr:MAG: PIN/TRAM domain-containing protein [Isosphaeraceae bacterium]
MLMTLIRAIFFLTVAGLAARLAQLVGGGSDNLLVPALAFVGVMLAAVAVVVCDLLIPRKKIQTISAVYFGLVVGLILSNLLQTALDPSLALLVSPESQNLLRPVILGILTVVICYICVSLLLQTKDDFRFIIPYMEFSRELKGSRPLVLDTSVVIDGRIADVAEARLLDQPLLVPSFVLQELQTIADSSDRLRRNRGRRGLDILQRLQKMPGLDIRIHEADDTPAGTPDSEVDKKLVALAKSLGGKVVTNDYNLNKVARLQGVEVINLNELSNALKPVVLPGETLEVKLIKRGEEPGQGVGYLDDGTMVVVEQGLHHLGERVRVTATSVLQTNAGRMIFGRLDLAPAPSSTPPRGSHQRDDRL